MSNGGNGEAVGEKSSELSIPDLRLLLGGRNFTSRGLQLSLGRLNGSWQGWGAMMMLMMMMMMKMIKRRTACFRKAPAAARDFAEAVDASNYMISLTPRRWPHSRDTSQEYTQAKKEEGKTRITLQPLMQLLKSLGNPIYQRPLKLHAYLPCS